MSGRGPNGRREPGLSPSGRRAELGSRGPGANPGHDLTRLGSRPESLTVRTRAARASVGVAAPSGRAPRSRRTDQVPRFGYLSAGTRPTRIAYRTRPVTSWMPESSHQLRPVCLHGLDRHPEDGRDLGVAVTLGDELDDLGLARRQALEGALRRRLTTREVADDMARNGGRQVGPAAHHRAERKTELGEVRILQEIAGGAGLERPPDVFLVVVHRKHDHARRGILDRRPGSARQGRRDAAS